MTIFAIIRQHTAINNDALETRISAKYPGKFYRLGTGQWLVFSDKTPQELSEELGIVPGAHYGNTFIAAVEKYYGLYNKKLWDWIDARKAEEGES